MSLVFSATLRGTDHVPRLSLDDNDKLLNSSVGI